jgi:hypothetical protein
MIAVREPVRSRLQAARAGSPGVEGVDIAVSTAELARSTCSAAVTTIWSAARSTACVASRTFSADSLIAARALARTAFADVRVVVAASRAMPRAAVTVLPTADCLRVARVFREADFARFAGLRRAVARFATLRLAVVRRADARLALPRLAVVRRRARTGRRRAGFLDFFLAAMGAFLRMILKVTKVAGARLSGSR